MTKELWKIVGVTPDIDERAPFGASLRVTFQSEGGSNYHIDLHGRNVAAVLELEGVTGPEELLGRAKELEVDDGHATVVGWPPSGAFNG